MIDENFCDCSFGGYYHRKTISLVQADILLGIVKYRFAATDVGPNRSISWQKGPPTPSGDGESPPLNIILIVADDLGYNDISTFGGGSLKRQTLISWLLRRPYLPSHILVLAPVRFLTQ